MCLTLETNEQQHLLLDKSYPKASRLASFVNLAQDRVIWVEGTWIEKMSPSDCPAHTSLKHFLSDWCGRAQPTTVGWCYPGQGSWFIEGSKLNEPWQQDIEQHSVWSMLCFCSEFPQWGTIRRDVGWNRPSELLLGATAIERKLD